MTKQTVTKRRVPHFRLRLWPTLGTVVGLALLVSLGTWQVRRYQQKVDRETQRDQRIDQPAVSVDSLADFEAIARPYTPVEIRGHLDADYTFLFAHRVHDGKPGYWVGGVLHFADGPGAVLVNRGWVRREKADTFVQTPPPTSPQTFTGLIHQPRDIVADDQARKALAGSNAALKDHVTQWDSYDLTGIADALALPTPAKPTVVVLGPAHSGSPYPVASYDYVTHPYLTSARHLSYACFWFVTAAALLGMYLAAGFGYLGTRHPVDSSRP